MSANNISVNDAFASDNLRDSSSGSARSNEVNRRFYGELELVHIVAAQVSMSVDNSVEFDELLAAGREGLFEAARRYDPKYGASFALTRTIESKAQSLTRFGDNSNCRARLTQNSTH